MRWVLRTLVCLFSVCFAINPVRAAAPTFHWVQQAGGTDVDYSTAVAVDGLGNTFLLGRVSSSPATFGGAGLSNGPVFLAKLNASGDVVWANGLSSDVWFYAAPRFYRMAADGLGGAFIGGTFNSSTLTLAGVTLTNSSPGFAAAFLARFDGSGNPAMARVIGTNTDNLTADAVGSDGAGNLFLAGRCYSATALGLTNTGGGFYAAEFNANGSLVWAKFLTSASGSLTQPLAISPLPNSAALVGGWFTTPTITFDNTTLTNQSNWSHFLVKYDAGRSVAWARSVALTTPLTGLSYALHGDAAGNIYVFGNTGDYTSPTSVSWDGCTLTNMGGLQFLFKLAPDGQVMWCRKIGAFTGAAPYAQGAATDCAVDAQGNCYVVGEFQGNVSFDSITLTNAGGTGAQAGDYPGYFLAKINPLGTFVWAKTFGADDLNYYDEPFHDSPAVRVAADALGNCSFAASLNRTNSLFDLFTLTTFGIRDAVVARLDADLPHLNISPIGDTLVMSWPTNQPGFGLECANTLPPANGWIAVTNAITVAGGQNFVTNPVTAGSQFYRLRKP